MNVILLGNMRKLGALGETVNVKPGFARNFLIPTGKAVYANKANVAQFEQRRAEFEKIAAEKLSQAASRQEKINALPVIVIAAKAGDEGKLFGSVGVRDITEALNKAGVEVEKREVRLPEGPFRNIGEYEVNLELESDIIATVKINITAGN